jgi:hypothetical protein
MFGVGTDSFDFDSNYLRFLIAGGTSGGLVTAAVFRDTSAWMHLVLSVDTTQATAANRFKLYVNGIQITQFSTTVYPNQNSDTSINSTATHYIGALGTGSQPFDGYLADIHFIDGQALTPTSFGEFSATTGVWVPKAYTGSYGTNGGQLKFEDNSSNTATTLGKDTSGNGNNWTPNNLSIITGGPTSVVAGSGALPIYNTTDTYGATKGTGTRTDAYASSLVLAIPMDGANNGTTFTDESASIRGSGSAKTITRNGDTKTSTAQSKFYGSSGFFDGTGDLLQAASSADFAFGTDEFSVEFWYYHISGNDRGLFANNSGSSVGVNFLVGASSVFRIYNGTIGNNLADFGASPTANTWQHIAVVRQSGIVTLYVNGVASGATNWAGVNAGNAATFSVGSAFGDARFANGYIQDFRVYKGVAKYTSNFNPPSSTQNATIAAGNDSLIDVPTNGSEVDSGLGGQVRGNYATWNPLDKGSVTLTNGNLDASAVIDNNVKGTVAVPESTKIYFEFTVTQRGSGGAQSPIVGICTPVTINTSNIDIQTSLIWCYAATGQKLGGGASYTSYGNSLSANDVLGVAIDRANGRIWFSKNGTWQNSGTPTNGSDASAAFANVPTTGTIHIVYGNNNSTPGTGSLNAGQRPFAYTAPSGFKALCTANLPAPTIVKPSTVFDTKLYTSNAGTNVISGLGFSPDLAWLKSRGTAVAHALYDTVRGAGRALSSNLTDVEKYTTDGFVSFNSDGFTLGANTSSPQPDINFTNNVARVAWCWDAGSTTVTNTAGSITSQVRANASAGFSVVTYTGNGSSGATVGHGLGVAPRFLIGMDRTGGNWQVWGANMNNGSFDCVMNLNTTDALATGITTRFRAASSTTYTIGTDADINSNGNAYVTYCFAPVAGYSSFGSYTGNGSADGPFVYTGFRPRFLLLKCSSVGDAFQHWHMFDSVRNAYNQMNARLQANSSAAEDSFSVIDFTSNGFKLRYADAYFNQSGATYVWAAFAEAPFQYARAR